MWADVLVTLFTSISVYVFESSALCCAPNKSKKIFSDTSQGIDNVKVSVALTVAVMVVPVTNKVLPVTIVWVVEPSDT